MELFWRSSGGTHLPEVLAQVLGTALLSEEVEGLHLDLAHPLAGNVELAAYLLEGAGPVVLHSEAELDDLSLPLRQLVQGLPEVQLQERLGDSLRGCHGGSLLHKIAPRAWVLFPHRGFPDRKGGVGGKRGDFGGGRCLKKKKNASNQRQR